MPSRLPLIFRNTHGELRNGWWIALFLAFLFLGLLPALLISQHYGHALGIWEQAGLILAATGLCQTLRRRPITEITGRLDLAWLRDLGLGLAGGGALMAAPAVILFAGGWVRFEVTDATLPTLALATLAMTGVALAEELLFRGFLFQRFVAGLGAWPAQLILAGLFLLTHLGNGGMHGPAAILAMINLFLASLVFGQAWLRTKRLALPIGLHLGANLLQGTILGFSVSGTDDVTWLKARLMPVPDWLTGGPVGLEGSLPGLICLIGLMAIVYHKPRAQSDKVCSSFRINCASKQRSRAECVLILPKRIRSS